MSEQISTPEIKTGELLKVVDGLSFEYGERFTFNESRYLLLLCTQEEVDSGEPREEVFYSASTADPGGWDIYMLETLSESDKKRRMFHEILECNLVDRGFQQKLSHELARKAEEETFGPR